MHSSFLIDLSELHYNMALLLLYKYNVDKVLFRITFWH